MDSLYIIIIILIFVLFLCILAVFLMNIFNNNLKNMKIVLNPKFDTSKSNTNDLRQMYSPEFSHTLNSKEQPLYKNIVEGFDNGDTTKNMRADQYGRDMRFEDVSKYYYEKDNMDFTEKSERKQNYPNLDEMIGLELQNFLYNYPKNMTIKDYENWLKLQIKYDRREKIPDIHHKYYDKIRNGKKLKYIKNKCPPENNMPLFMAGNEVFDFYKNMYDSEKIKLNNKTNII
jgi:hypothetical protein